MNFAPTWFEPSLATLAPSPGHAWGPYPQQREPRSAALRSTFLAGLSMFDAWRDESAGHQRFITRVRHFEQQARPWNDPLLRRRVASLRALLGRDGLTEHRITRALGLVAETCRRALGKQPFDTQLIAARILLSNRLAEMQTGEGKTLAAALAAAVAALAGIPVHVITANDYLVSRDRELVAPLFDALGLRSAAVIQPMPADERRIAYRANITYCTAKELVFDYLRDRMAIGLDDPELALKVASFESSRRESRGTLLRGLCMAIVDEADSILIDEAVTPLILAQAIDDPHREALLRDAWDLSGRLWRNRDFLIDAGARSAALTNGGSELLARLTADKRGLWQNRMRCEELVLLALSARHLYHRDRDYLVRGDEVAIVDETTGRVAEGRSWSRGLHQLIEIKEGCKVTGERQTIAQITYQRFFPRYLRLCGMSGTLAESRAELASVYGLRVAPVPLRRPSGRRLAAPVVYATADAKWRAVVMAIAAQHAAGRPVLVGTDSVADSDHLSGLLDTAGITHRALNARQDAEEAAIVAAAGHAGAVTVATNMAGRGTDIELDATSRGAGGLHVIACHRNRDRRIDRQLFGRSARQGDPGSVQIFVSLEDDLAQRALPVVWRAFGRRHTSGSPLPSALGHLPLALAQRIEERRRRRQRRLLLEQDRAREGALAFTGSGE